MYTLRLLGLGTFTGQLGTIKIKGTRGIPEVMNTLKAIFPLGWVGKAQ